MDKFQTKDKQFEEIMEKAIELFSKKNRNYNNDYFEGGYSDAERWMSVKRKVARLTSHYNNGQESLISDESIEDTWMDLAVYCIMELIILDERRSEEKDGKINK